MAVEDIGLRISLRDRRTAAAGLRETKTEVQQLGTAAEKSGRQAENAGAKWDRLRGAVGGIGRLALGGVAALGALGAAGAATGVKTAAAMEQAKIGFTTMLGSGRRARSFLGELAAFAAKTPFEFPELQTAASSLVSAGIDADKVIPIMTTLGDVTAGMGTGSEGIQRATIALQQMTAAGKVNGEDLNQLRDAGIPVYDLLSSALGKTKAEVVDLASKGKLGGDALTAMMKALETGQGLERFNGLMEKQSSSLSGVWSTLKDTVTMGLAGAVKPAMPLVKDLVLAASDLAQKAMPQLKQGVRGAVDGLQGLVDAYQAGGIKAVLDQLRGGGGAAAGGGVLGSIAAAVGGVDWGKLGTSLGTVGTALGEVDFGKLAAAGVSGIADSITVFGVAVQFAADHVDTLAKYLPLLIAAFVVYKAAQAANNVVSLASIPIQAAQIGSNLALASANRALATQMALTTGAENVGMLTRIRATAATVASTVAGTAASVASKAWAAAQWLLNAAMTANPIGLLVVGIAALVAAVVWIATKTDWFQRLWAVAWGGIKAAAAAVWNWVKGNWPLLLGILTGPIGLAVVLIAKNWDRIKAGAGAVKDFVVDRFTAMIGFFRSIPGRITSAVSGAFDGIKNGFRNAINWIIDKWNGLSFGIPSVDTGIPGVGRIGGFNIGTPDIPRLARGGPVVAGRPYIVGDGGRPELFVPGQNGRVLPKVPPMPTPWGSADIDAQLGDGGDLQVGPGAGGTITVQLVVDGQVLTEAVLDNLDDRAARR